MVAAYNTRHSCAIKVLPKWPPHSPDLNPIENLWSWLEAEADALACKTLSEHKRAVLNLLKNVPKRIVKSLIASMPKRIQEVIRLKGGKTKY